MSELSRLDRAEMLFWQLECLETRGKNLTEWEAKFIFAMKKKIETFGIFSITPNQVEHITTVFEDRVINESIS